jgi:signal transduction histidine kinase
MSLLSLPALDPRYQVGAHGGPGRVVRAWDAVGQRHVAFKRFEGQGGDPLLWHRRFWRWSRLTHPRLVQVLDYGADAAGTPVLVMAWLEGQTLASLGRSRRLSTGEITEVVLGVAEALDAMHAAGLVHGDVKPGNCMVGPDGVVLLDWGGEALGTLGYVRPARLLGAPPSPADDWHALAVLGAELLLDCPIQSLPSVAVLRERLAAAPAGPLAEALQALLGDDLADHAALRARLVPGAEPPVTGPGFRPEVPLLGREAALAQVLGSVERDAGPLGAVLVWGEGGVGKSRLVREALQRLPQLSLGVGQGRPDRRIPLEPWREALGALAAAIEPPPALRAWLGGDAVEREVLFEAVQAWLVHSPDGRIWLEDLQWLDAASLELFARVVGGLGRAGRAGRLWATSRPAPAVAPLRDARHVALVELGPLEAEPAAALVAAHLGAGAGADLSLDELALVAGGNPLLLGALAAEWGAAPAGPTRAAPTDRPAGLEMVLERLVQRLGDDGRTLLRWGRLLGQRFGWAELHALTAWAPERLFDAVGELRAAHLWVEHGDGLGFRHDRLREALPDAQPEAAQAQDHARVADVLGGFAAPAARLAPHLRAAGRRADALEAFARAGDAHAAVGASSEAFSAWCDALSLADAHEAAPAVRQALWQRLAPLTIAVDPVRGIALLEQARAHPPVPSSAGLWAARWPVEAVPRLLYTAYAAICHALVGGPAAAEGCLATVATELDGAPRWLQGALLLPRCTVAGWEMRMGDAAAGATAALEALKEAPAGLDEALAPLRSLAHFYRLAGAVYRRGECPEAWLEACVAEARRAGLADLESIGLAQRVGALGLAGGWWALEAAQAAFDQSRERAGLSHSLIGEGLARRAVACLHHGAWEDALRLEADFPPFLAGSFYEVWVFSPLIAAACLTGDTARARVLLERVEAAGSSPWYGLLLARAFVAVWEGRPDAREAIATVLAEEGPGPRWQPAHEAWAWRLRAELAAREGDEAGVAAALDEAARCAPSFPLQAAITLFWRARLASSAAARADHVEAASEAFAALGAAPWLARLEALRATALWVLAEGRPAEEASPHALLEALLARAMAATKAVRAKLLLLEDGGGVRTAASLTHPGAAPVEAFSRTVVRQVVEGRRLLWVADVASDERFQQSVSLEALDVPTVVGVPLALGGRLEGLFYLELSRGTGVDSGVLEALDGLAAHAALALSHGRLAAEARVLQERAERAAAAAAEREAVLAQVLHDMRNAVQALACMHDELVPWAEEHPALAAPVAGIEGQVDFLEEFLRHKLSQLLAREQASPSAALGDVARTLAQRFRPLCQRRGLTLEVDAMPEAWLVISEVECLQLFGNLLENAVKFSYEGGLVRLDAHLAGAWAHVRVTDTGPGFEATRAHPARASGLGLQHSRALVRQAGGWLHITSTPAGATVEVGLPLAKGRRTPGERPFGEATPQASV